MTTDQSPIAGLQALAREMLESGQRCEIEVLADQAERYTALLGACTEPLPLTAYQGALDGAKKARCFRELVRIAEQLTRQGHGTPYVRTLHAQGLIELRQISVAIQLLQSVVRDTPKGDYYRLEAFGLLGRAYKQLFVDEKRMPPQTYGADDLMRSINNYAAGYLDSPSDDKLWHSLNIAALVKRAERDKIEFTPPIDRHALTREIIERLEPKGAHAAMNDLDLWTPGTIANAYLNQENWDKAAYWYGRYAQQDKIDAFKLIGTIRQLEQVYGISCGNDPAGRILTSLKARAARLRAGHASFESADIAALKELPNDDRLLEAVLGTKAPAEIKWLKTGLDRACSVATILRKRGRRPHGTGFLVRGRDLLPSLGDEVFLLTNYHVLSDPPHPRAIRPDEAVITFDEVAGSKTYDCTGIVWSSVVEELDASLVRLEPRVEGLTPLPIAPDDLLPDSYRDGGDKAHAYVIGRPEGQLLSISLHDSEVVDFGYKHAGRPHHTYIHYKTPTKPGNSGSPVFDEFDWQVIGLHHMGPQSSGGNRKLHGKTGFNPPANEGIAIRSIRRQIAADKA
jgi:V8-like Glu-specific endopeptidase